MGKQGIAYDWKFLGAVLANEGDDVQADFLKSFVKEMDNWGTQFQKESQLLGVNQKLTEHERDILGCLGFKK